MIPDSFIQQIKQYSDIEAVVSSYRVHLTKKGRTLVGLCPFHSEKSGSFFVYPQTQSFYCFGCGAGGDVITFVRKIENLDYIEAVRLLAQKAGMQVPDSEEDNHAARMKTRILEMNRETARFYHQCLISEEGKHAYRYLLERGRTPKMITRFGLGYAPDAWDATEKHLQSKGFTTEEMAAAGLIGKSKKGSHYDQFRNRVIFPIIDLRGNVIAFGGRALEDRGPKYLNSSDTPVFKKSRNLFALNFAKTSKQPGLILAEGYMDVIALHQAGFSNAVATLGTSLTEEQARLISQYTDQVVIAYDSDSAGQTATNRAINIFDQVGVKVRVLTVTGAKDPDEFIKVFGAQRFQMLLDGCSNAMDFEVGKIRAKYDLETADGKVNFLKEFCRLLAGIRNPVEREVYLSQISQELQVAPSAVQAQVDSIVKAKVKAERRKERNDTNIYIGALAAGQNDLQRKQHLESAVAEEGILHALMKNPDFLSRLEGQISPEDFVTDINRELYTILTRRLQNGESIHLVYLSKDLSPDAMGRLSGIMVSAPEQRCSVQELDDCVKRLKEQKKKKTQKELAEMDAQELQDYIRSLRKKV